MTSDRETAEAELVYATADRLCEQPDPVEDVAIAHESGVDLETVRRWLDEAEDTRFEVRTFGSTRTVVRGRSM
ncbi:hypothetical protein [Nocardioides pantholopis]|uniref:hypothetical protein n=1 Tax=Nocardioides pantholopis TaxID=2483798 RepID=UPI000F07EEB5|nr:hypothetical protein [Nocardioides pantholopis]